MGDLYDDWILRLGSRAQCRCHFLLIISLMLLLLGVQDGLIRRDLLADGRLPDSSLARDRRERASLGDAQEGPDEIEFVGAHA